VVYIRIIRELASTDTIILNIMSKYLSTKKLYFCFPLLPPFTSKPFLVLYRLKYLSHFKFIPWYVLFIYLCIDIIIVFDFSRDYASFFYAFGFFFCNTHIYSALLIIILQNKKFHFDFYFLLSQYKM